MARPVGELLAAADRLDPRDEVRHLAVRGSDEFGELSERFNSMVDRLKAAHVEHQASIRKSAESQRLAALGSLMAGVAHEVNNPLAGLKNCVTALRRKQLSPEAEVEYLELMSSSVDRIENIVRRLLDFGRPQPLHLRPEPVERLTREAAALVAPLMKAHRVELDLTAEENGRTSVLADRHQVAQALLNLLLNALYVTPQGGRVRLRVRDRDGLRGIAVEDEGPGIPAELRERVLDPFFSTKPEGEGTGLGLSVTRAIVEAHGGELTLEFPGRGTVATVWLRPAGEDSGRLGTELLPERLS
jgi:signal transduction histidine kinase